MAARYDDSAHEQAYLNAEAIMEWTGCTYRRLDRWARHGLLGAQLQGVGSGGRRSYQPRHFELVDAFTRLADLGAELDHLAKAALALEPRAVLSDGEVLVVPLEGAAFRTGHACFDPSSEPSWVVPLRRAPTRENAPAAVSARAF